MGGVYDPHTGAVYTNPAAEDDLWDLELEGDEVHIVPHDPEREKTKPARWLGIAVVLSASLLSFGADEKPPVDERFAKFLMLEKSEFLAAFADLIATSRRQQNVRGLNDAQRKCIGDYIDKTKDQLFRFRQATDDVDYESFASLKRKDPKKARELAEERWPKIVEVSADSARALLEEQECLIEAGGRFSSSDRNTQYED